MAFYGCQFSFNGVPCFEYGLMVYDVGGNSEDGRFASTPTSIVEDRTSRRYSPLHYGTISNTALSFTFTFGADVNSLDKSEYLDRWEMDAIASWLTGHDEYKYLEITQPDMEAVRYKCIISDLEYTTFGSLPWAFRCTVTCDSPYAYLYPKTYSYGVSANKSIRFNNRASSKYYYPKLKITLYSGGSISIVNHSDNDREFLFTGVGANPIEIYVDNDYEIITNNKGLNLYDCFNFKFLRLVRGFNNLEITAEDATVDIECEFPINIGG